MSDEYDPLLDELRSERPYRNRAGEPITLRQWSELRETGEGIIVAKTLTAAGEVSTVWLGIDHAFSGPPQIFETMVFATEESTMKLGDRDFTYHEDVGGIQERYETEEEALHGHLRIVEELGGPVT